jgi:vacuolar protein sorting-associated protein 45
MSTSSNKGKQPATPSMDAIKGIRDYVSAMIDSVKGVKVLLLDEHTNAIISVAFTQSELMKSEVFLVDLLKSEKREKMPNVRCITFLRPTRDNYHLLKEELADPKYQAYSLFFSNQIDSDNLEKLASSDKRESVQHVYTFYADYMALDHQLFTIPTSVIELLRNQWGSASLDRILEGLMSVLCAVKKRPTIRYQGNSEVCKRIAKELRQKVENDNNEVFNSKHFRTQQSPMLLILDRRDDPVTPLLSQWTYQAMLHELVGIHNNRVTVMQEKHEEQPTQDGSKEKKKKKKEMVISAQDSFFAQNQYSNWGDLCENIKHLMDDYKVRHNVRDTINSIDDIAKFMSQYPEFRKFATEVDKHVALVSDLRTKIGQRRLMDVSELEQDIVCSDDHSSHIKRLKELIADDRISKDDKLRLVILYTLKYENTKREIDPLKEMLKEKQVPDISLIDHVLEYGGSKVRNQGLFSQTSGSEQGGVLHSLVATITQGFVDKEVKNVFTQHKPLLHSTLDKLFKGKLSESAFPWASLTDRSPPREVIVFIVGGVTYEEALTVHLFNTQQQQQQGSLHPSQTSSQSSTQRSVLLGGTSVLNSSIFLKDLRTFGGDIAF